jgi:hypothetical protein
MNSMVNSCTRRTLATGDVASVEQCLCGTVHVAIGAVRLQLPACALASVADTMLEAARALERHAREMAGPRELAS